MKRFPVRWKLTASESSSGYNDLYPIGLSLALTQPSDEYVNVFKKKIV